MIAKIALTIITVFILYILIHPVNYKKCFSDREHEGFVKNGHCCGMCGGTRNTDYLSEICCGCPYLKLESKYKVD